jgi:hypothetical protein
MPFEEREELAKAFLLTILPLFLLAFGADQF